jgi:putative serine protease PepD
MKHCWPFASIALVTALLALASLSWPALTEAEGSAAVTGARAAVVRVEASVDPISAGPGLAAQLAARQALPPYQAELSRRLRIGSTGTGFFVNADGYLVTTAHVVLSGVRYRGLHFARTEWDSMTRLLTVIRDIWVTVGEGEEQRSYLAEPVAIAEHLDLAVLRVVRPPDDDTSFSYLPLANSDAVAVGDPVRALGFADGTFQDSKGAVLSLIAGREVHERMNIVRRTDPATGQEIVTVSGTSPGPVMRLHHNAPVGHGNSGGPILDGAGRVIGVAYALISDQRASGEVDPELSGLNLAIASNVLRQFLAANGVEYVEREP